MSLVESEYDKFHFLYFSISGIEASFLEYIHNLLVHIFVLYKIILDEAGCFLLLFPFK